MQVGGWNDDRFVPTCVLQTLLGGGDSFSAGGPGKGMNSRLYTQVLNKYFWAESAEAFTSMHTESGLLGIAGAAPPNKAAEMMHIFCEHFALVSKALLYNSCSYKAEFAQVN
jgi:mitochondrial-processing peptidase subunit alpha